MAGKLILIVGASGAGKDTLCRLVRQSLPSALPLCFVPREITRPASPFEHHDAVSSSTFERRLEAGYYVLHWNAHDVRYGIPARARVALERGHSVVSICSRAALDAARTLPWECHVVEIQAPLAVLRTRLLARGREAGRALTRRLERASAFHVDGPNVHVIDNGGALDVSHGAMHRLLLELARP